MLEIRTCCEHCGKDLPNQSTEAMICSFECTYCRDCAIGIFSNVCPGCDGNFEKRPIRPKRHLLKNALSNQRIYKPKDLSETILKREKFKNIPPDER